MATVYLAIQESLERPVVLKILDSVDVTKSEDLVERFLAEGRIIASLNHPNIITIYDIGLTNNNSLFISMEYVQGGDLKQQLELTISPEKTLEYIMLVSSALSEAHKHGIVHRDVKPANILFKDDTPILTDFGIAKQVDVEADLTSTGIFLGSPNYVSPEQADGYKLDGRADIYSLGCIFYEMLMGSKPYKSDSVIGIVIQHQQAPIPRLDDDLIEYQPLLEKMLAKKREDRFPDAEALIKDLKKLMLRGTRHTVVADLDNTSGYLSATAEQRVKREKKILISLILLGLVGFSTLEYVDIQLKNPSAKENNSQVSTETVLQTNAITIAAQTSVAGSDQEVIESARREQSTQQPVKEEVVNALYFLGKQSLGENKLTYPPKDNAYYYFTRLLEMKPGDQNAIKGILSIADQYSFMAEQAMRENEYEKSSVYIDYGLRINPENTALLSLKTFIQSQKSTSLWSTFKGIFSGN